MKSTILAKAVIIAGFMGGCVTAASALELRAGSGGPPTHPSNNPTYTTFVEKLNELSGGTLTARPMGLEVATLANAISNLQSGVLDVANVLTLYFAADFPHSMLVSELATLGSNGQAMTGAVTEYIMTCEPCIAEFAAKGIVYLGTGSTSPYNIISRIPIRSLADLKGKRLRSGGAPFTRWAEGLGAQPAEVSFNEEYESIANGLLDGTIAPPINILTGKLYEIAPYITTVDIGTFHSASNFTTRQQTWKKLSPEQREWLVTAASWGVAAHGAGFAAGDLKVRDVKVEFLEPAADLVEANLAFAAKAKEAATELGISRYKIENASAEVERFATLVEKWNGLVGDSDATDVGKMASMIQTEIFSKIDWNSYGQ